jgi:hypothetical protein
MDFIESFDSEIKSILRSKLCKLLLTKDRVIDAADLCIKYPMRKDGIATDVMMEVFTKLLACNQTDKAHLLFDNLQCTECCWLLSKKYAEIGQADRALKTFTSLNNKTSDYETLFMRLLVQCGHAVQAFQVLQKQSAYLTQDAAAVFSLLVDSQKVDVALQCVKQHPRACSTTSKEALLVQLISARRDADIFTLLDYCCSNAQEQERLQMILCGSL